MNTIILYYSEKSTLFRGRRHFVSAKVKKELLLIARQNLFFAFVYNSARFFITAGILSPVLEILLSPMIADAAMTFRLVSVITSGALRLQKI